MIYLPKALVRSQVAFVLIVIAVQSAQNELHPSPKASTSLVCPTNDPSDCYPSIFQPTIHFQPIRPDQSIPPGLHVRLNLATGEKEARLNVPEEEENIQQGAIVVLDEGGDQGEQKETGADDEERLIEPLQLKLQHALAQEKHAKPFKPPPSMVDDPAEYSLFEKAVSHLVEPKNLHTDSRAILSSLKNLTELAHSLDWGLTITRDAKLCACLVDFISKPALGDLKIRSESILILGTAVQNNPEALAALVSREIHEDTLSPRPYPGAESPGILLAVMSVLAEQKSPLAEDPDEDEAIIVGRAVFTLSQLCSDSTQMGRWLRRQKAGSGDDGLSQFLDILNDVRPHNRQNRLTSGVEEKLQKIISRIANFMTDHLETIANQLRTKDGTALRQWCSVFTSLLDEELGEAIISSVMEARHELSRVLTIHKQVPCDQTARSKAELPEF